MNKSEIREILRLMDKNYERAMSALLKKFKENNVSEKDYLFVLTDNLYDERTCRDAIEILLLGEFCPTNYAGDFKYNFIQNAIYEGYSDKFIIDLINFASSLKDKLNVNHQDEDGDTMLHTAIYADDFNGNILELYKTLIQYGFDSRIRDNSNRNIVDAMIYEKKRSNKFSDEEIVEINKLYNKEIDKLYNKEVDNKEKLPLDKVLETMGYDLNNNEKILRKELPKLGININRSLHALTDNLHNELCCFAAIKALCNCECCYLNETEDAGYNFIQNAMYAGYSTAFINGCIDASMNFNLKHKLNINHQDEDGDTMLHTAIYCNDECVVDIASIYKTLLKYGFDSKLVDNDERNIVEAMIYEKRRCNKFSDEQIQAVEEIYNRATNISEKFSKKEQEENKRLDKYRLEEFLKKCKR